ncbi:hypothetical protein J5N97_021274 [Dioscorea zingiberensis]|uniref:Secreted protein n=1 Tax=Dioscorea zingiberensis TaxID=325984 RepID=A0A9D5CJK6_9LILI|nr:hypothetical protein J5N97_021274 [Dioscorea zingiberensis]
MLLWVFIALLCIVHTTFLEAVMKPICFLNAFFFLCECVALLPFPALLWPSNLQMATVMQLGWPIALPTTAAVLLDNGQYIGEGSSSLLHFGIQKTRKQSDLGLATV